MIYQLRMSPKSEWLIIDEETIKLDHLGVLNLITRQIPQPFEKNKNTIEQNSSILKYLITKIMEPLSTEDIFLIYQQFLRSLEGKITEHGQYQEDPLVDVLIPPPEFDQWNIFGEHIKRKGSKAFWLAIEYVCLWQAIEQWLTPSWETGNYQRPQKMFKNKSYQQPNKGLSYSWLAYLAASKGDKKYTVEDMLKDPELAAEIFYTRTRSEDWGPILIKQYMELVFRYRTRQIKAEFFMAADSKVKKTESKKDTTYFTYIYSSENPLALAWMEIMWAIERNFYAHTCDICGGAMLLSRPYKRMAYLCSKDCRKAQRIKNRGGNEEFKKYNRDRRRMSREMIKLRQN